MLKQSLDLLWHSAELIWLSIRPVNDCYRTVTNEKRTKTYIEIFGYDAWETTFRCPNYDYEYFDKLDEKDEYERAMYEEQEREKDNKRYDYMDYEQNTEYLND